MDRIQRTEIELEVELQRQLITLKKLSETYDEGHVLMARPIATILRLLERDTGRSKSLLGQLGIKNIEFFDSSANLPTEKQGYKLASTFNGLFGFSSNQTGIVYIPYKDNPPPGAYGYVPFEEYWTRVIFVDKHANHFTRADIVSAVADTDGGAHVDPGIEVKYHQLTRENSLGWEISVDGEHWENAFGVEYAAVRQIAHEFLRTLLKDYPEQELTGVNGMMFGGFVLQTAQPSDVVGSGVPSVVAASQKIGRNEKCPCGSGIKYKKCHG
jgi:hypothetical protein